jgi:hypothetical protein
MYLGFPKNKRNSARTLLAKILSGYVLRAQYFVVALLFVVMGVAANNLGYADEEENRRVDISLSIFPRIVAVDNNFRSKLNSENKVELAFIYSEDKERAQSLVEMLITKNKNIGGMGVSARAVNLRKLLNFSKEIKLTAIFIKK